MFLGFVNVTANSCANSYVLHVSIFVCGLFWRYCRVPSCPIDRYSKLLILVSASSHVYLSTYGALNSMVLHSFSQSILLLGF